jgi:hypothetical protein
MRHKNETEQISTYGLVFEGVDAALRFTNFALLALGVGVMASISSSSLETLIAVVVNFLPLFGGDESRKRGESTGSVLKIFSEDSLSESGGGDATMVGALFLLTISIRREGSKFNVLTFH